MSGVTRRKQPTTRRLPFLLALVLATAYVVAIVAGLLDEDARLGTPEIILLIALLVLTAYSVEEFAVGPSGFSARLEKLDERQEELASEVEALQITLAGLVTKWELIHLQHLAEDEPYDVRFSYPMKRELDRLDATGYVQPVDPENGLNAIDVQSGTADHFDLKQYVEITEEGRQYLKQRAHWLDARP